MATRSRKLEVEIVSSNKGSGFADAGKDAGKLAKQLDGAETSARRLDKIVGQGGRNFGGYGTGLGGIADRADEVDTRMMGLSDGIQGVGDLMRGDLAPHEYAMALSDLGSSIYNFVIPSLQGLGKNLITNAGNMAKMAGAHVAHAARVVASWVLMGVTATVNAAKMAVAWVIALGPVALVIAGVIAAIALLVIHWDTVSDVAVRVWETIHGAVKTVWEWLQSNWPLLLAILTGPFGLAVLAITRNWDTIKAGASAAVQWVKDRFNDVVSFITGMPGRIAGAARGMWDGIAAAFKGAINTIIRGWNRIEFKIPGFKVGPVGFGGFTLGVPDIPQLAHGGIVTGPTLALLGDNPSGREAVIPLDRGGGLGSTTIVVQNSGVIGSQGEMERWLFAALESATRKGVLPGQSTRKAFAR